MRTPLLALSLLTGIAAAQTLPYRRAEALGPAVPDGTSTAFSLQDSGWALIGTGAANLPNPARFPRQYFFRSPEGALTRLPMEKTGINPRFGTLGMLSDDASFAMIGGPYTDPVTVDRNGNVRVYPLNIPGRWPVAIVGRTAYLTGFSLGLTKLDLDSGAETAVPSPDLSSYYALARVSSDNTKATYQTYNNYYAVQNLTNGLVRTWTPAQPYVGTILDTSGRYVWTLRPASAWAGPILERHDLYGGEDLPYGAIVGANATLTAATDRYVFFTTADSLASADDNSTADVYAFDRTTGKVALVTDRKGSSRAAGGVESFFVSPRGGLTMFSTASPSVADLPSNGVSQLYARSLARHDTAPALPASGPGGGNTLDGLASRGGTAVLSASVAGSAYSLHVIRDGQPTLVIPVDAAARPLDVTDDGRIAVWCNAADNSGLKASFDGVVQSLDIGTDGVQKARIDPKTGTVLALTYSGSNTRLLRFNRQTGAATVIADGVQSYDFDADAGRVAWSDSANTYVADLGTGSVVTIPAPGGKVAGNPKLTADGVYVGVPISTTSYSDFTETRLYRASDGAFRRTVPYGWILPDGKWLYDPNTADLVYLATGARVIDAIDYSASTEGIPVGPERAVFYGTTQFNSVTVGDVWRYHAVAPNLPITSFFSTQAAPGGYIKLRSEFRKAGLENIATWTEVRVDGTGPWRRMKPGDDPTLLHLTDGTHQLEERANDNKGRIENRTTRRSVVADSIPPTVGAISATHTTDGEILTVETDASSGYAMVTAPDGTTIQFYGTRSGTTLKANVSYGIEAGKTYKYKFTVRDRAGNVSTSAEGTFTG